MSPMQHVDSGRSGGHVSALTLPTMRASGKRTFSRIPISSGADEQAFRERRVRPFATSNRRISVPSYTYIPVRWIVRTSLSQEHPRESSSHLR